MTQIDVPPQQQTRRRWVPFAVAGAFVVVAGVITTVVLVANSASLSDARTQCEAGILGDGGDTLLIDMMGEEYTSGTATIGDVDCVLAELDAPTSVTARMDSTRALDGMQTATWDGYSVSWTYHPDDGLDLIITESD
jgi:hypothetical protein